MDENIQTLKIDSRKVIKVSKKKIKIVFIILGILVLLVLGAFFFRIFGFNGGRYGATLEQLDPSMVPSLPNTMEYDNSGSRDMMITSNYYPDYQKPTISDTREFLKTNFSASIKTRDVKNVVQEVTNIVKGSDGRIDSSDSTEKYGRISFVVPKSKFESFQDQIENIAHKKLYTENISSQNLLNQKQNIEEQTGNIVNTLGNLQNQKATLLTNHNQTVSTINKELSRLKSELVSLRAVIAQTTDPLVLAPLRVQESTLLKQEVAQKQKLSTENSTYTIQNQNLDNLINNSNNNLTEVNKQDSQFTDNIETVEGYVGVEWINLWQMAKIFSPIHPTFIIIILLIITWIILKRKQKIPRIEFQ